MTLKLTLETAPHTQREQERVFLGGSLSIGRGDDADWQLNDPDMYVSRRHCIISDESGQPMITDASSGGLFIDNSANPVGAGNSVPLEPGMTLRIGDFVIGVAAATADAPAPEPVKSAQPGAFDFQFGAPPPQEDRRDRPDSLPDPFDPRAKSRGIDPFGLSDEDEERPLKPLDWENPMELDLRSEGPVTETGGMLKRDPFAPQDDTASAMPSETPPELPPVQEAPASQPSDESGSKYFFGGAPAPAPSAPQPREIPADPPIVAQARNETPNPAPTPQPVAPPAPPAASNPASESALRDALIRGMGLDPAQIPSQNTEAEMEQLGARFRELVDGLMMLLRSRAQEKSRARVAQTIIANEDVNPLKFLATPEDAMAALLKPPAKGYLSPDQAVPWAYRDIMDHQLRTWTALQAALRRMIDRFDPEEIEKEAENLGLLEKLIAGGKSAKMWDMYEEHYRDLAKSAEEQFLGEVGADFREAYETKRSS
ncbi:type VI secretion system-associated FHA domain protein TagH [Rhodobacteraceae bacterium D3-12]|nr:type VI secretion system-associated FHA domain protein TagH [Rhodobacteraceae bacterium D3-12]